MVKHTHKILQKSRQFNQTEVKRQTEAILNLFEIIRGIKIKN